MEIENKKELEQVIKSLKYSLGYVQYNIDKLKELMKKEQGNG